MTRAARVVLGLSGLCAAALALLPALVAGLIALFDLSAHALLGTSGSLLGLAGSLVPADGGRGSLPPYARIDIHPWLAAAISIARGVPPACMAGFALRPGRRGLMVTAAALALVSDGVGGAVLAAPGALAVLVLR